MPALRFLSRRWLIGDDDLVLPHAAGALVRTAWAGLLTAMYVLHTRRSEDGSEGDGGGGGEGSKGCDGETDFFSFYSLGAITLFALSAVVDVAIAAVSAQGGIVDSRLRRRLGLHKLLAVMLLLRAVELVWTALGTYWVYGEKGDGDGDDRGGIGCPAAADRGFFQAVIISNWVLIALLLLAFWLVFDGHGHDARGTGARPGW